MNIRGVEMICPRCDSKNANFLTKSPVGDEWEVYICDDCYFSWRSTEDESIKDPEKYDPRFKINVIEVKSLPAIPPVPKLKI